MASTFTTLLRLNKPSLGDAGWGTAVNGGFTDLADSAIAGTTTLNTDADVTLTTANGAADQARQMILNCTGSRAAQRTITAPATSKVYVVINGTTGGFGVKIVGVGPTTGVVVPNGRMAVVAWNGSDFVTLGAVVDLTASGNVSFDGGTFVFNESGADRDARFEGDTDTNLLFLDASSDRIGIGTNNPQYKVDIAANANGLRGSRIRNSDSGSSASAVLQIGNDTNGAAAAVILHSSTNTTGVGGANALSIINGLAAPLVFATTNIERVRLDASGNFGIGTSTPTAKLDVVGAIVAGGAGGTLKQVDTTDDVAIQIYSDTANEGIIDCFQNSNPATKRTLSLQKYGGNVLIGLGNLEVNGSIRAKQGVPDASDSSTTGYAFGGDGDTGMFSPVVGGGSTNGVLAFYCNDQERLRMTSGNASLISTVDSAAPTLSTNSTMSFELTSNTSLKVVVRGTDGVTRSVSLTLS